MEFRQLENNIISDNTIVATCINGPWHTQLRNARLFAASQRMLEALTTITKAMRTVDIYSSEDMDKAYQNALDAINLANG
jgi:hypothetical protein